MYDLKQSGDKYEHTTGAVRDKREGKGRYDLISPRFLRRLALVLERGAKYYGDRNWEKGMPLHLYLDSAMRHTSQVLLHNKDEDHVAQAAWNLMAFIHTAELIEEGKLPRELDTVGYCPAEPSSPVTSENPEFEPDLEDRFMSWLSHGPKSIFETFKHFGEEGFSGEEIQAVRRRLTYLGLVSFTDPCEGEYSGYYKLVEGK